jgi:hypothetical protein
VCDVSPYIHSQCRSAAQFAQAIIPVLSFFLSLSYFFFTKPLPFYFLPCPSIGPFLLCLFPVFLFSTYLTLFQTSCVCKAIQTDFLNYAEQFSVGKKICVFGFIPNFCLEFREKISQVSKLFNQCCNC